jgi:fructose-1,6-bisphosphatase/inositol monophosphatase family enzyme
VIVDLDKVAAIIRETAEQEILPRFRGLAAADVWRKKSGQLVTVADTEAERWLAPRLAALLRGSVVVGEEASEDDPALLDRIAGERAVWLVDPLDGTSNFAEGKPAFAVMVGLVIEGRCVAGWIHDPLPNRTAVAAAGQGARLDGARLRVADAAPLGDMSGVLNLGYFDPAKRRRIRDRRDLLGKVESQRCAGHEYMALAAGRRHFALFNQIWPWDHAAGVLIHQQAGGFAARLDRSAYRPTQRNGGLLAAPDPGSWAALHAFLMAA